MPSKHFSRSLFVFVSILLLLMLLAVSVGYLNNQVGKSSGSVPEAVSGQSPVKHEEVARPVVYAKAPVQGSSAADLNYLGSATCGGCHQAQFQDWQNSHHSRSMQHASVNTVLADFNDISYKLAGRNSLFYKKGEAFFVRTAGPGGELADYQVLYTFGFTPLQQYVVSFPDGRLQMLPLAWDTLQNQWFYLQEALNPQTNEWIYWTKGGMNWNSMCADCHTTNLNKNYQADQQNYSTTWAAIDVGCEGCHGPGRDHVEVVGQSNYQAGISDPKVDMRTGEDAQIVVNKCGRCHSRRQQLTSVFEHNSDELLDHYLPAVLRNGLYHSDGQILDEVFVYGSFVQSKMYQNEVSCINCHEPHSGRLKAAANELCSSCHVSTRYDSPTHHHHAANTEEALNRPEQSQGNQCVDCHMPGRLYMVNDFRRDHSFRVPRPDLSVKYNTPNACADCHANKGAQWAANAVKDWFGENREAHFSEVLALSASQPALAIDPLLRLLENQSEPAIARATAAHILAPLIYMPPVMTAMKSALADPHALVRTIATRGFAGLEPKDKLQPLASLLLDPVRSVRIAAAGGLVEVQTKQIAQELRIAFKSTRTEYLDSLNINADFPFGRHQMAMDHQKQGQLHEAEKAYLETLKIDDHYNVARLNLAQLYYHQRRLPEVEALYRTVIEQEPAADTAHYSLGLLMAELGDLEQAEKSLEMAGNTGNNPRAWYNLGVLRHQQGNIPGAEASYLKALDIAPIDPDFLNGLVSLYSQQQQWAKVNKLVDNALVLSPGNTYILQLKRSIEQMQMKGN